MPKIVADGQVVVVPLFNSWNVGLTVRPDAGATTRVEFTFSSRADVEADMAKQPADADACLWDDWAHGPVTAKQSDVFDAKIAALRITSTGGASKFEVR